MHTRISGTLLIIGALCCGCGGDSDPGRVGCVLDDDCPNSLRCNVASSSCESMLVSAFSMSDAGSSTPTATAGGEGSGADAGTRADAATVGVDGGQASMVGIEAEDAATVEPGASGTSEPCSQEFCGGSAADSGSDAATTRRTTGSCSDELCNGEDDDCDGLVDEHLANACYDCEEQQETCNAEDDDCDGQIDEDEACLRVITIGRLIETGPADISVVRSDAEVDSNDWTMVSLVSQELWHDTTSVSFRLIWQTLEAEADKSTNATVIRSQRTFTYRVGGDIPGIAIAELISNPPSERRDHWFAGTNYELNAFPAYGLLSNIRVQFDGEDGPDTEAQRLFATLRFDLKVRMRP